MSEGYSEAIYKIAFRLGGAKYHASWGGDVEEIETESDMAEIACTYGINICDVEEAVQEQAEAHYHKLMGMVQKQIG